MRHQFLNTRPEVIDPDVPNTVHSRIEVSRVRGAIRDVNVLIDIQHTFDSDLEISLIAPNETKVLLVGREGGSRNNFQLTVFDDEARRDVQGAGAPFRGVFRPEGSGRSEDCRSTTKVKTGTTALDRSRAQRHKNGPLMERGDGQMGNVG